MYIYTRICKRNVGTDPSPRRQPRVIVTSMVLLSIMTWWHWKIFRVTGSLWGVSTCHRWFPLTNGSSVELWYFLWCTIEQTFEKIVVLPVILSEMTPTWCNCNGMVYCGMCLPMRPSASPHPLAHGLVGCTRCSVGYTDDVGFLVTTALRVLYICSILECIRTSVTVYFGIHNMLTTKT